MRCGDALAKGEDLESFKAALAKQRAAETPRRRRRRRAPGSRLPARAGSGCDPPFCVLRPRRVPLVSSLLFL